jgi:hypothetical protein
MTGPKSSKVVARDSPLEVEDGRKCKRRRRKDGTRAHSNQHLERTILESEFHAILLLWIVFLSKLD